MSLKTVAILTAVLSAAATAAQASNRPLSPHEREAALWPEAHETALLITEPQARIVVYTARVRVVTRAVVFHRQHRVVIAQVRTVRLSTAPSARFVYRTPIRTAAHVPINRPHVRLPAPNRPLVTRTTTPRVAAPRIAAPRVATPRAVTQPRAPWRNHPLLDLRSG